MEKLEAVIGEKQCILYLEKDAEYILIQPVDGNDMKLLDSEVEFIKKKTGKKFSLAAFKVNDWNSELTPWEAPLVFGKGNFGNKAFVTLEYVRNKLIPGLEKYTGTGHRKYILGGYSLAGLFSLWCGYQTDIFFGIAACSPSVWYENWIDYVQSAEFLAKNIYLSLGDTEEKSRNRTMSRVSECMMAQDELLKKTEGLDYFFEWNEGGHFKETDMRMAKGFSYILNK